MHLLWLRLGTDAGLTLIKLSCEAQTLDHEYYRGYGVMGQLYYSEKLHFSGGLRWEDRTAICLTLLPCKTGLLNFLTLLRDF